MIPEIQLQDLGKYAESVNVYDSGNVTVYASEEVKFKEICSAWSGMLTLSRQMPAFGVSLNDETVKAIKSNLWVEFVFNCEYCNNGMTFERLLVNVSPDYSGFNVIRYLPARGYDGRCFYFDLIDSTMSDFYNVIKK
ncbi:MAG: hypothetical protein ACI4MS_00110 [Candidatus Coproplasma sp.]